MNTPDTDDLYATFIPVLEAVLSVIGGDVHAIEYGGGMYSTPLLIERCASVLTIERNAKWRERLWSEHGGAGNWVLLDDIPSPAGAGLVFVDDVRDKRVEVANAAFSTGVPVVVIHDTEQNCYGYRNLAPGDSYVRYDYATDYKIHKRTSVFALLDIAPDLEAIKPERHTRLS